MKAHEYAFDVKLFALIRVVAVSESEARATLRDTLDAISCSAGEWPDASPIKFEASVDDEEGGVLVEIDNEPIRSDPRYTYSARFFLCSRCK